MPIYTYRCESCGVQFEKNQKFSDAPLTRCPECGKKSLRKVYQPVGIVFKGSGFYSTDHRSPSGGTRAGGAHGEGSHTEEKSSGESKPASSSDSSASTPSSPSTSESKAEK
jgi:putative FmdB family regulatory protein